MRTATEELAKSRTSSLMDDLVISIGTIDRYEMLERCLRSVYGGEMTGLQYRVVVVLNGSGADKIAARLRANFPQTELLIYQAPLGFCRLHNLVMGQYQARYFLLLDDDTILARNTLSHMVRFMDEHTDVGIAGCKTLHPDATFQKTYGLMHSLKTELLSSVFIDGFWPDRIYRDLESPKDVAWLNGSFLFARAETLRVVGFLDERFYTYVCEPDWCYRISKAGWRVMFVPSTDIIHECGDHSIYTLNRTALQIVRTYVNRFYFFHKHYSPLSLFLLRPIFLIGAVLRVLKYLVVIGIAPAQRKQAAVRAKAFLRVAALSLSPRPYELPASMFPG